MIRKQIFVQPRPTASVGLTKSDYLRRRIELPFRKEESIFNEFQEDNQIQMRLMLDHDFKQWEVLMVMKAYSDADVYHVKRIYQVFAKPLKDLFISLAASHAEYPKISFKTLLNFLAALNFFETEHYQYTIADFTMHFA